MARTVGMSIRGLCPELRRSRIDLIRFGRYPSPYRGQFVRGIAPFGFARMIVPDLIARNLAFGGVIAGAFLLAACADTRGGTIPYDRDLAAPDVPKVTTLAEDYKIHPLD